MPPTKAEPYAELIDVRQLVPYERNPRKHSEAQIAQLKDAFRRFGFIGIIAFAAPDKLRKGHGSRQAAMEMWEAGEEVPAPGKRGVLPQWHLPAVDVSGLSEEELRAFVIADNQLALLSEWDMEILPGELRALQDLEFDMPVIGFDEKALERMLAGEPEGGKGRSLGNIAAEFLIPPFSVLNAREGWWQERKRGWLALGIQSEVGRGGNLIGRSLPDRLAIIVPGHYREAKAFIEQHRAAGLDDAAIEAKAIELYGKAKNAVPGGAGANSVYLSKGFEGAEGEAQTGTSIFDPVLCELVYRWFAPQGGLVLDPFAGGSVRGIVAGKLGRRYVGIDLRREQVEANQAQADQIMGEGEPRPEWQVGDSREFLPLDREAYDSPADLIFSCPPYGSLEVYSDDPADLSTMKLEEFRAAYAAIIRRAVDSLKPDRFACIVVGDYRDEEGIYTNFVGETIAAFQAAGARLYNEVILVTAVGSLAIRIAKQFRSTRKMGKTHQQLLVFVKGDPRKATEACGPVDVSAALADIEPEENDLGDQPAKPKGDGQVKISAAMARLEFIQCGPDCIAAGCKGNCCDAPSRPSGCMITINPDEQDRIEALGGVVKAGLLQPRPGEKGCPFKKDGLCDLHASGQKPWGCIASPFTLNRNGTLIVRNRYRLLPCYRNEGPKAPAYLTFRSSLEIIFGPEETARIVAHLDAGGGDLIASIDPAIKAKLLQNDDIKRAAKAEIGGEV